jgi:hypothetical protein
MRERRHPWLLFEKHEQGRREDRPVPIALGPLKAAELKLEMRGPGIPQIANEQFAEPLAPVLGELIVLDLARYP